MFSHKLGVFIGRFQPFHNGHYSVLKQGLEYCERILILVGSANLSVSSRNPFVYEYRRQLILESITEEERSRIDFLPINDYPYDDNYWCEQVRSCVVKSSKEKIANSEIALIGYDKDETSYYLKSFPEWEFISSNCHSELSASDIRDDLFKSDTGSWENKRFSVRYNLEDKVPEYVLTKMIEFCKTQKFVELRSEWEFIRREKEKWNHTPYPPIFVTTDAVIKNDNKVLLVSRKNQPGRALLALPGGFINENESIYNACLRELKEETGLDLDELTFKNIAKEVFDSPCRSLRGRTITHAYMFEIDDIPKLNAADDAENLDWYDIDSIEANSMFEDHYFIINQLMKIGKGEKKWMTI